MQIKPGLTIFQNIHLCFDQIFDRFCKNSDLAMDFNFLILTMEHDDSYEQQSIHKYDISDEELRLLCIDLLAFIDSGKLYSGRGSVNDMMKAVPRQ